MQFEKVHTKRILAFLNPETMNISDGLMTIMGR